MTRPLDASQRFHLIGGPGSGKTTLARRIAATHPGPVIDLDHVGYRAEGGKRPLDEKLVEVSRIAAQPAWISEGIFLGWTAELLDRAEVIVWLDLPWRVAAWRIVRRHLLASLGGTNRHAGLRRLVGFLGFARRYYLAPAATPAATPAAAPAAAPAAMPAGLDDDASVTRAATAAVLRGYAAKVIRCQRAADVAALTHRLGKPGTDLFSAAEFEPGESGPDPD